jgi:hypothetical protein
MIKKNERKFTVSGCEGLYYFFIYPATLDENLSCEVFIAGINVFYFEKYNSASDCNRVAYFSFVFIVDISVLHFE